MNNRPTEQRTLFFNFAHEPDHETTTYEMVIGGRHHRLQHVKAQGSAAILHRERLGNAFLRALPDHALTHIVETAVVPADTVQLVHVVSSPDRNTGTWSMSRMFFHMPTSAVAAAFQRHAALAGPGAGHCRPSGAATALRRRSRRRISWRRRR